ncbi:MAG: undecaprenyl-diphosphate phosphatase, partial [Candidatus Omnitrophica bacterium]|nr:undecaprenyl-diphosphate phosphatase [Candidatus Omnitrophota bacterium]
YIFLGLVQGLTEFLPVSSSAHLVLLQNLLQVRENQLLLDIVLHLGTLSAVILFLFKELKYLLKLRIITFLFLATALTAVIVILGADYFEGLFNSTQTLILPLVLTGLILISTKNFSKGKRMLANLRLLDAICLGLAQGLSVIPGLSRSGLTISCLIRRNVEKETAVKFSLLASIPAIIGAVVFKFKDFSQLGLGQWKYLGVGFLAAFFSGILALQILLLVIRRAQFHLFGYYCIFLALILFAFFR